MRDSVFAGAFRLVGMVLVCLAMGSVARAQIRTADERSLLNPFGVKAHLAWTVLHGETFYDEAAVRQSLSMMQEIGIGWVSFDFSWSSIEAAPGVYDYSRIDELVSVVSEYGLHVFPTLISTPEWATTAPDGSDPRTIRIHAPRDRADFARFVYKTVSRYKGVIQTWEIWNEPNNQDFFVSPGSLLPRAEDYLSLLKAAYVAAKTADPSCTVVLGGVALNGLRQSPNLLNEHLTPGWLEDFYQAGGQRFFDVLNMHPYPYSDPHGSHLDQVREARDVAIAYGDRDKKIWMSEINGDFFEGDNDNATPLRQIYVDLLREPYVDKVFWYNFRNRAPGDVPAGRSINSGLVTFELERKDNFFEFHNLVRVAREWYLRRHGRGSQLKRIGSG